MAPESNSNSNSNSDSDSNSNSNSPTGDAGRNPGPNTNRNKNNRNANNAVVEAPPAVALDIPVNAGVPVASASASVPVPASAPAHTPAMAALIAASAAVSASGTLTQTLAQTDLDTFFQRTVTQRQAQMAAWQRENENGSSPATAAPATATAAPATATATATASASVPPLLWHSHRVCEPGVGPCGDEVLAALDPRDHPRVDAPILRPAKKRKQGGTRAGALPPNTTSTSTSTSASPPWLSPPSRSRSRSHSASPVAVAVTVATPATATATTPATATATATAFDYSNSILSRLFEPDRKQKPALWEFVRLVAPGPAVKPPPNQYKWRSKDAVAAYCLRCKVAFTYTPGTSQTVRRHLQAHHWGKEGKDNDNDNDTNANANTNTNTNTNANTPGSNSNSKTKTKNKTKGPGRATSTPTKKQQQKPHPQPQPQTQQKQPRSGARNATARGEPSTPTPKKNRSESNPSKENANNGSSRKRARPPAYTHTHPHAQTHAQPQHTASEKHNNTNKALSSPTPVAGGDRTNSNGNSNGNNAPAAGVSGMGGSSCVPPGHGDRYTRDERSARALVRWMVGSYQSPEALHYCSGSGNSGGSNSGSDNNGGSNRNRNRNRNLFAEFCETLDPSFRLPEPSALRERHDALHRRLAERIRGELLGPLVDKDKDDKDAEEVDAVVDVERTTDAVGASSKVKSGLGFGFEFGSVSVRRVRVVRIADDPTPFRASSSRYSSSYNSSSNSSSGARTGIVGTGNNYSRSVGPPIAPTIVVATADRNRAVAGGESQPQSQSQSQSQPPPSSNCNEEPTKPGNLNSMQRVEDEDEEEQHAFTPDTSTSTDTSTDTDYEYSGRSIPIEARWYYPVRVTLCHPESFRLVSCVIAVIPGGNDNSNGNGNGKDNPYARIVERALRKQKIPLERITGVVVCGDDGGNVIPPRRVDDGGSTTGLLSPSPSPDETETETETGTMDLAVAWQQRGNECRCLLERLDETVARALRAPSVAPHLGILEEVWFGTGKTSGGSAPASASIENHNYSNSNSNNNNNNNNNHRESGFRVLERNAGAGTTTARTIGALSAYERLEAFVSGTRTTEDTKQQLPHEWRSQQQQQQQQQYQYQYQHTTHREILDIFKILDTLRPFRDAFRTLSDDAYPTVGLAIPVLRRIRAVLLQQKGMEKEKGTENENNGNGNISSSSSSSSSSKRSKPDGSGSDSVSDGLLSLWLLPGLLHDAILKEFTTAFASVLRDHPRSMWTMLLDPRLIAMRGLSQDEQASARSSLIDEVARLFLARHNNNNNNTDRENETEDDDHAKPATTRASTATVGGTHNASTRHKGHGAPLSSSSSSFPSTMGGIFWGDDDDGENPAGTDTPGGGDRNRQSAANYARASVDAYFRAVQSERRIPDPLRWWNQHKDRFPELAKLARRWLCAAVVVGNSGGREKSVDTANADADTPIVVLPRDGCSTEEAICRRIFLHDNLDWI